MQQRRDRALGQARIHREGDVRAAEQLVDHHGERAGQPLPAIFGRHRDAHPAAVGVLLVGFLEAGRRGDAAVVVALAAFEVADAVERLHALPRRTSRLPPGSPRARRATHRRSPACCRSAPCETRRSAGTARRPRAPCRSASYLSSILFVVVAPLFNRIHSSRARRASPSSHHWHASVRRRRGRCRPSAVRAARCARRISSARP